MRFALRKPTDATDGIDRAYLWVSDSPFGVSVTSAASTIAFLSTVTGTNPNMTLAPFANFVDVDYALPATMTGKYLLGRFYNTSDGDSNRNLGVRTVQIGQIGIVPEPTTAALLLCFAALAGGCLRQRRRI